MVRMYYIVRFVKGYCRGKMKGKPTSCRNMMSDIMVKNNVKQSKLKVG